jgi:hypothetical protein
MDDFLSEPNRSIVGLELCGQSLSWSNSKNLDNEEDLVAEMRVLYNAYSQLLHAWEGPISRDVRTLLNMLQAERRDAVVRQV